MRYAKSYLADFVALLFPKLCSACNVTLVNNEQVLCTGCLYHLPYTHSHKHPHNLTAQQLYGKLPVEAAYSLYHFTKGSKVQTLIHKLKYEGIQEIGLEIGRMAAKQLAENKIFNTTDLIVPVPLHRRKLLKRGYNQSTLFATGIASVLNIPVEEHNLVRISATKTQTQKSRFDRFKNVEDVFQVNNPEKLENKHILLVDDIITTGATMEACGKVLLTIPGVKLSIATIAVAE